MNWENRTILIAEDEDANYYLLQEYLEPTGIKIHRAINGLEVLDFIKNNNPDIILLDIKMPVMSGFEVAKRIRSLNNSVPIIAQTAYSMMGDKENIISVGCNDYVSKPIEEDVLIDKIKQYLTF
jgi:CheY-like chemotaxis protein